jgi:hypothetical protein
VVTIDLSGGLRPSGLRHDGFADDEARDAHITG